MEFSVIVPVYNRPMEIRDLLQSLRQQLFRDFEVIIVEDGSDATCESIVDSYRDSLLLQYLYLPNQGQGFARNEGMKLAKAGYFVFFDSDCIIPANYFKDLRQAIVSRNLDAHGGPDAAAWDFSPMQKAMDFAMTSFWTTGGIRGKLRNPAKYQARGYNMGFSRKVWEAVGGFADPNRAEDIELSMRIKKAGFRLELVEETFVYHKRKNTLSSFAKQGLSFGRNRVHVSRFHPGAIKAVHLLPLVFVLFLASMLVTPFVDPLLFLIQFLLLLAWSAAVITSALERHKNPITAGLSWVCSTIQLSAYGLGLGLGLLKKWMKG